MAICKVTLSGIHYGQLNQNRFYLNTGEGAFDPRLVALDIKNIWMPSYRKLACEDMVWFNINVAGVGGQANLNHNEPINITGGQLTEPNRVPFGAFVLQLNTGLAGRKFRGRIYVPAPRDGDFRLGVITAQGVTLSTLVCDELMASFADVGANSGPYRLVIHGETEAHDTIVNSISARSTYGCQRRRNIGVGA